MPCAPHMDAGESHLIRSSVPVVSGTGHLCSIAAPVHVGRLSSDKITALVVNANFSA
jgi:hypothetical protein